MNATTTEGGKADPSDVLDASLGTILDTGSGPVVVASRRFSSEAESRPAVAAAMAAGDAAALSAALGPAEEAVLTSTGLHADLSGWCKGETHQGDAWAMYYERWTAAGRVSHGWACGVPACRRIIQSG